MNKNAKIVLSVFVLGLLFSCKQSFENEESTLDLSKISTTDSSAVLSSSSSVEDKKSERKFIRTADLKFKVKDVAQSTYAIENTTKKMGGFVTYTHLQSTISEQDKTKISEDSTLITTKFRVDNNITIRIPNAKLDTIIKSIAKQIQFLDYRSISATDVSLQILANELASNRSKLMEKRLKNQIDKKGTKLNQIVDAEHELDVKKEQNDSAALENVSIKDQINFSTLSLNLYQDDSISQEMIPNEKNALAYRPNIGLQIWESIKKGWYLLENIISFAVMIWPLLFLSFIGYFGYKKFLR